MAQPVFSSFRMSAEPKALRADVFRWLYLGRLTLVSGILASALFAWFDALPEDTLVATVMFVVALVVTAVSFWYTHVLRREPGEAFRYGQVVLDVLLVTGVVHVTGGPESSFAPLYILVISAGALLLPLPGGVLIGALASIVYFADLAWGHESTLTLEVGLRIGLFALVAVVTGILGDRLRRAGQALGAVASELEQLRLDTSDVLANLSAGVLTVDGDHRLAYANPAAESLLRLDLTEMLGKPVLRVLDQVAPGMGRSLEHALGDRRTRSRSRATVERGNEAIRLGISTTLLDRGDDTPPSVTAIFEDITDLERIDELNLRTERLEAVATLSASLAHEIKNPLASIRSAIEQLEGEQLGTEDRTLLRRLVLNESDRLSRLLSEFLDYSAVRLGAQERVELRSVVLECIAVAREHPDLENIDLQVEVDEDPVPVLGDADLLHRALLNLVLNAGHYAGTGGTVVVSLEDERYRRTPRGVNISSPVRLAVRDSGPGIPPEVASRIFDPFFSTRKGGSGLGLALVHRAVEAHAGVVFVERAIEGGAQFVIFLPGLSEADQGEHT
ncbi:MAG: ATP-binding protein [Gemmatimonadota bacterium]|nr:ATP-binding protein [Gemmatimonadota bacterium]